MDNQQVAIEGFQSLQDKAKALATEAGALKRVAMSLSKLEGYQNLRRLEHDLTTLESLALLPEESLEMARTAVAAARLWLQDEWSRRASVFSEELGVYLQDRAISTQVAGNEIRMDPFILILEPARDSAVISYSGEPIGKPLAMSCPMVFKAYSDSISLLERNQTPPESFSDELLEAYAETCRWKGIKQGGRVRLSDVHFTIFARRQSSTVRCDPRKGRIKEYPRYQFAWDLGLLLKNPDWMVRSGSTITLNPSPASSARSRTDSVRVFSPDGCDQVLGTMQV
jgi:hypothetical protein